MRGKLKLIEIHLRGYREPAAADVAAAPSRISISSCSATTCRSTATSHPTKSLKAVLEGGIEGRPENVILYATSNRRHLLARDMIENERSTAINPGEAVEEKVSHVGSFRPGGLASTSAARTNISKWCAAIASTSASRWLTIS